MIPVRVITTVKIATRALERSGALTNVQIRAREVFIGFGLSWVSSDLLALPVAFSSVSLLLAAGAVACSFLGSLSSLLDGQWLSSGSLLSFMDQPFGFFSPAHLDSRPVTIPSLPPMPCVPWKSLAPPQRLGAT